MLGLLLLLCYERITIDPNQMGGVSCIRGLRIPVATIVTMVAEGMTQEQILAAYPDPEPEDIREALCYAAEPAPACGEFEGGRISGD